MFLDGFSDGWGKLLIFAQYTYDRNYENSCIESDNLFRKPFINGIKRIVKFRSPSKCPFTAPIDVPIAFPRHRRVAS